MFIFFFFFKQKTAYEMRISDWSSDVCSSELIAFRRAREKPEKVKEFLTNKLKANLGDHYDAEAFTPPYNPWEQRLCLVPDADFFEAMKAGKASVVTDPIERFDAAGIQLKSGKHLEADNIITATGLKLAVESGR